MPYLTGALFSLENRIHQTANSGQDLTSYIIEARGYAGDWPVTADFTQPSGTGMSFSQSGYINRALNKKTFEVSGVSFSGNYLI